MATCRGTANIWFYLKRLEFRWVIKSLRNEYFWQDSFWTYWNRLIGCRILGHRKIYKKLDEDGDFCFNCYRNV